MKPNKRWVFVMIVFVVSSVLATQVNSVRATFSDMHATAVLIRVETEIMQKTPAGQYYETLFWKHNDELIEIARKYPEHAVEFSRVTRMFVPGLEALLDGKGDTVQVTPEQIESLKAELDWYISVVSPALQEDIQRELQRFPLDQFVGMTMNEALDFVNASWSSGTEIPKTFVADSNGKWAYYVHDGVYFEYPGSYTLQPSGAQENSIYLVPSTGTPDEWKPYVMRIRFLNIPANEVDQQNPRSRYAPEHIGWESTIQAAEFPGVRFAARVPNWPVSTLHAFQYNEANQLAVHTMVYAYEKFDIHNPVDASEMLDQRFEYFQHIVDSLRIQRP